MIKISKPNSLLLLSISLLLLFGCANQIIEPHIQSEKNVGELYTNIEAWNKVVSDKLRGKEAFSFVKADPNLSNVLLIGNSISIGYTEYVRNELNRIANVFRIPVNGGDTRKAIEQIDRWLDNNNWDVIHFNWGLHDLKRIVDKKMDIKGASNVPVEENKQSCCDRWCDNWSVNFNEYLGNCSFITSRIWRCC